MTYMRAGRLRHWVTFEINEGGPDEFGEPEDDWREQFGAWARVTPLQGRDRWTAAQTSAEVTHEVEMRQDDRVRANMRIRHKGRILNIVAPTDTDERGRQGILYCQEEVA